MINILKLANKVLVTILIFKKNALWRCVQYLGGATDRLHAQPTCSQSSTLFIYVYIYK